VNYAQVAALAALSGRTGSEQVATPKKAREVIEEMYRQLKDSPDDTTGLGRGSCLFIKRIKVDEDEHWTYRLTLTLGYLFDGFGDTVTIQDEHSEYGW
jgi:hypothetical protein